jgi:hypothetical protein
VAATCTFAIAAEPGKATAQVPGQKLDSGLGELPHYRHWADSTGKNPVRGSVPAQVAGESKDSGLGELPHYSLWANKFDRADVRVSQAK